MEKGNNMSTERFVAESILEQNEGLKGQYDARHREVKNLDVLKGGQRYVSH
jgi:hypothetical protein